MIRVQDHVYYKGGSKPQYTMMSPQNLEVVLLNITQILCNLGYKCEPKVFIEIQRNQYNPYQANRCVEVEHGRNSIEYQLMSVTDN